MRGSMSTLSVVLVAMLFLASPTGAACSQTTEGEILLPTASSSPPEVREPALQGVTLYWIASPGAGLFTLKSVAPVQTFCLPSPGSCSVEAKLPDFNVAFYKNDQMIGNHNALGDESAGVPTGADAALVYMRHGPDFSAFGLHNADGSPAAKFVYASGC